MAYFEAEGCKKNFSIIFEKKNNEQIFTSLCFKISPSLPKFFCDLEAHNLTEVWTHLKNGVSSILLVSARHQRSSLNSFMVRSVPTTLKNTT